MFYYGSSAKPLYARTERKHGQTQAANRWEEIRRIPIGLRLLFKEDWGVVIEFPLKI